jgi:hypothetical protein
VKDLIPQEVGERKIYLTAIFEAIKKLMALPPEKPRRIIGFKQE